METYGKTDALVVENAELKKANAELAAQVKILSAELLLMRQRLFGVSSERTKKQVIADDGQLNLFNEAEHEYVAETPAYVADSEDELQEIRYNRKKKKGKRELDLSGFEVERVVHELPVEERGCPKCGKPLTVCGHDVVRRELVRIPAQYKITEQVQAVYVCNDIECQDFEDKTTMVKATVPSPLIPGSGVASASLVAHVVIKNTRLRCRYIAKSRNLSAITSLYPDKQWQTG